jgi:L-threonylcarbamoyladenylate synthase
VTSGTPTVEEALSLERCLAEGGVAVFPTDTVYGLGCDPQSQTAVERLYELKGRPADRPAAVMFFALNSALEALPELGEAERVAMCKLLPGPLTLLLPNPRRRFPLAGGPDRERSDSLGLRVPLLPERLQVLRAVRVAAMQSSANLSGEPDVRHLVEVPARLYEGADLVIDGGQLPGVASTVLDLRHYGREGRWSIVREGPVGHAELERALA